MRLTFLVGVLSISAGTDFIRPQSSYESIPNVYVPPKDFDMFHLMGSIYKSRSITALFFVVIQNLFAFLTPPTSVGVLLL